jgi:hypothetical protein
MYEVLEAKKKEKTFREFLTSDHFKSWSKAEAEKAAAAEAAAAAEVAVMNHSESELEEEESNGGEESDDDDDDDDHFHLGSIEVEHHEWSSSGQDQGGENENRGQDQDGQSWFASRDRASRMSTGGASLVSAGLVESPAITVSCTLEALRTPAQKREKAAASAAGRWRKKAAEA